MTTPPNQEQAVVHIAVFARTQQADFAIMSILALQDFERFCLCDVRFLERYSEQDCSVLLDCSRQDIRETKTRALQHVAESNRPRILAEVEVDSNDRAEQHKRENLNWCHGVWRPLS